MPKGERMPSAVEQQQKTNPKPRRRRRRPGDEEEPVLRTTCDACTSAKVKCNGEKPCTRCGNKDIQCEYTFKKRCGPKRRKGMIAGDGGGLLAPYSGANDCGIGGGFSDGIGGGYSGVVGVGGKVLGLDDHLRGESTALSRDEVECINVFMQNINSFLPLTTFETVKRAARDTVAGAGESKAAAGAVGGEVGSEDLDKVYHARKAMLHAAIALGAEFLDKQEASLAHADVARQKIKECFDSVAPELVAAYLILAIYWTHHRDGLKTSRCVGLARDIMGNTREPPAAVAAALKFMSVGLYDAKVINNTGCRVDPPAASNKTGLPPTPEAYQARVLNILSFILLAIHNRSSKVDEDLAMATGQWDPKVMTEHVYEAKALLDKGSPGGGSNDISRCIVVVLQAYFLLLTDNRRQAIVITEPLADIVADNPLVLHVPIVRAMAGCVQALLGSAGRTIAVERLQSALDRRQLSSNAESALASHLRSSTDANFVEKALMRAFSGRQAPAVCRRGATTAISAAAAAAAAAARATELSMSRAVLMRQTKGQTSSLNVAGRDYIHRGGRTPIASMLSISDLDEEPEASEAPRRRPLPSSTSAASAIPGLSRSGGGVSQSLLSAAMKSAGEPILPSSAPPSRAAALAASLAAGRGPRAAAAAAVTLVAPEQHLLPSDLSFTAAPGYLESVKDELSGCGGGVGVGGNGSTTGGEGLVLEGSNVKPADGSRTQLMKRQRAQHASLCLDMAWPFEDEGAGAPAAGEDDGDGDGGGKPVGDRTQLMRRYREQQASFCPDAPVSPNLAGVGDDEHLEKRGDAVPQHGFNSDAPVNTGDGGGGAGAPAAGEDDGDGDGGGKPMGDRTQLMRRLREQQASFCPDAPVSPNLAGVGDDEHLEEKRDDAVPQHGFNTDVLANVGEGRGGSGGGGGGGTKLGQDRSELMMTQHAKQSFVADAPVSLEQVESTIAQLGDSGSVGGRHGGRSLSPVDLDAAAELLASKLP